MGERGTSKPICFGVVFVSHRAELVSTSTGPEEFFLTESVCQTSCHWILGDYRFEDDGEYFLQVSGLFGQGCPDCTYQVRVWRDGQTGSPSSEDVQPAWSERSLSRRLTGPWVERLRARAVQRGAASQPALASAAGTPQTESLQVRMPDQNQVKDRLVKPGPKSDSVSSPLFLKDRLIRQGRSTLSHIPCEARPKAGF